MLIEIHRDGVNFSRNVSVLNSERERGGGGGGKRLDVLKLGITDSCE